MLWNCEGIWNLGLTDVSLCLKDVKMLFLRACEFPWDKATDSFTEKNAQADDHIANTRSQEKNWGWGCRGGETVKLRHKERKEGKKEWNKYKINT